MTPSSDAETSRLALLVALVAMVGVGGCRASEASSSARRQALGGDGSPDRGSVDAAPSDGSGGCGRVTGVGCCDGQTVWWCDDRGRLRSRSCAGRPLCGWSDSERYDCNTSGVSDPSGVHPKRCASVAGEAGVPGSDRGVGDGGPACGKVTEEGCCAGDTLRYCDDGKLRQVSCALNRHCGWHPGGQLYDCGTEGAVDPSGVFAKVCPGYVGTDARQDAPDRGGDLAGDLGGDAPPPDSDDGCACAAHPGAPGWGALVLVALAAIRRRAG